MFNGVDKIEQNVCDAAGCSIFHPVKFNNVFTGKLNRNASMKRKRNQEIIISNRIYKKVYKTTNEKVCIKIHLKGSTDLHFCSGILFMLFSYNRRCC